MGLMELSIHTLVTLPFIMWKRLASFSGEGPRPKSAQPALPLVLNALLK